MATLTRTVKWLTVMALVAVAGQAHAIDFEKKLKYDSSCVVKALSSAGDVYLECKDQKSILKTTVDLPLASTLIGQQFDLKKQIETEKEFARARVVWSILNFSFSTQLHVLLTFNQDKTLIRDAVAYMQPEFDEKVGRKGKLDL